MGMIAIRKIRPHSKNHCLIARPELWFAEMNPLDLCYFVWRWDWMLPPIRVWTSWMPSGHVGDCSDRGEVSGGGGGEVHHSFHTHPDQKRSAPSKIEYKLITFPLMLGIV